jgi:hypothetical protein
MRVAFGEFVLDTAMRQLFRGGTRVHLEPKALELLELLVSRRPEAVSKIEIQRPLAEHVRVESSLTGLVRRCAGPGRRPKAGRFLRTVHGFGYAFIGESPPRRMEAAAWAQLLWEDAVFPLPPGDHVLGRSEEARSCRAGSLAASRDCGADGIGDHRRPREQERNVRG